MDIINFLTFSHEVCFIEVLSVGRMGHKRMNLKHRTFRKKKPIYEISNELSKGQVSMDEADNLIEIQT